MQLGKREATPQFIYLSYRLIDSDLPLPKKATSTHSHPRARGSALPSTDMVVKLCNDVVVVQVHEHKPKKTLGEKSQDSACGGFEMFGETSM